MFSGKRIAVAVDSLETEYSQQIVKDISELISAASGIPVILDIGIINDDDTSYRYQKLGAASLINTNNFDGMVFVATNQLRHVSRDRLYSYLKSFAPLPTVALGCEFSDIPGVLVSLKKTIKDLIEHLIKVHKKKNFALMSTETKGEVATAVADAFREALFENGIAFDKKKELRGGLTYDSAAAALRGYRDSAGGFDFDAIVTLDDEAAKACVDVLTAAGKRVPDDIAVTGFGNTERASCCFPSLSTIDRNAEGQARRACDLLLGLFADRAPRGGAAEQSGEEPPAAVAKAVVQSFPVFRQTCGCIEPEDKSGDGILPDGKREPSKVRDIADYGLNKWYTNKAYFIDIFNKYTQYQADSSLDDLRKTINDDLLSFDINAAAICLFEQPVTTGKFDFFKMPDQMRLFSAYDKRSKASTGGSDAVFFNPNETIVPATCISSLKGMIVSSLYHKTRALGYIAFLPGNSDYSIYPLICQMISACIASAIVYGYTKEQLKQITSEYNMAYTVALTDDMTGLLNRRGFITLGSKIMEGARSRGVQGLLLYGDIDGLKDINDTYGHEAGDRAIKAEAHLLKTAFRSSDVIARLGGDEFAILALGLAEDRFFELRNRLQKLCDGYNQMSGEPFTLSISVGYSPFGGNAGYDINALLKVADSSLYEKKREKHKNSKSEKKEEARFYSRGNELYFPNGKKVAVKASLRMRGENCADDYRSEKDALYLVYVQRSSLEIAEGRPNEGFLSSLRDWLKRLENINSCAIIFPVIDRSSDTPEDERDITESFKHCARRIKDCENVIGFVVPEEVDAKMFIDELRIKHEHYIFFSDNPLLLETDDTIVRI